MSAVAKKKIFDNRYEIISIISRSLNSVVYLAKTLTEPYNDIAIKVLTNKRNENSSEKLRSEAIAMVASKHKYVMGLDDFNTIGDISYLSMDYAPGSDLRNYIKSNNGIPTNQAVRFLKQITEALAHLHNEGIIHHDLKPDNILVINDRLVKLTDFDLTTLPGQSTDIDVIQKGVGTLDYMAPEILEGTNSTFASDIYALSLSFYEVLTGTNPFADSPLSQILDIRKDGLKDISLIVSDLEPNISKAIMNGLIYDQNLRIQNGTDFLNALNDSNYGIIETPAQKETSNIGNLNSIMANDKDQDWNNFLNELEQTNAEDKNTSITKEYDPNSATTKEYKIEPKSEDNKLEVDPFSDFDPFETKELNENKLINNSQDKPKDFDPFADVDPFATKEQANPSSESSQKNGPASEQSWDDFLKSLEDENTENKEVKPDSKSDDDKAWDDFLKSLEEENNVPQKKEEPAKLNELNISTKPNFDDFKEELKEDIRDTSPDFFTEIKEEKNEFVEKAPINFEVNSKKKTPGIFYVIGFIFLAYLIKSFFFSASNTTTSVTKVDTVVVPETKTALDLSNFPRLSPGIYNGKIHGLFKENKNITFITNEQKMLVLLDVPGWEPAIIDLNKTNLHKLTIASSGYILKLIVDEHQGNLKYKDEVTKVRGEWEITSKE